MRAGRIVAVVAGALGVLVALGLVAAGGTLIWAQETQRDAAGYYTTPTEQLVSSGYALTGEVDFGARTTQADWVPVHVLGTVRLRVRAIAGSPVFVGIAPTHTVERWLTGVPHTRVVSLSYGPFETKTEAIRGTRAPSPPGSQTFWTASATGGGTQTVHWVAEGGKWTAVVMSADAAAGVAVDASVGTKTGLLLPIGAGVGAFGLLLLVGAALLMAFGLHEAPRAREPVQPSLFPESAVSGLRPAAYPARVDGHLDPAVSRWLWLVKWLLVLPHLVVLALLWMAAVVLTVVAGVSILVSGRYPRGIFDFNVGVMRWTWRVTFYAIGAFATDRYLPFSLAPDPTYPADFSVEYPERLSRGLVLVKWWLLAIPQYLIVAAFVGGSESTGLIGILAIVAAVILAVSGRYPDEIFDFVMGMHRWSYRVLVYAALMRDEYPPFRLDTGGTDPGTQPSAQGQLPLAA